MKGGRPHVELTRPQVERAMRMIGKLQTHLESAIDGELQPGTAEPMPGRARLVAFLRREWRNSEDLIAQLADSLTRSKRGGRI